MSESAAILRPVGAIGVGEADLELGADRRQRAAQLVRRRRREQLLAVGRVLQAVEHVVERGAEAVDLGVAAGRADAARQVGRLDLVDLGPHRVDRAPAPAR